MVSSNGSVLQHCNCGCEERWRNTGPRNRLVVVRYTHLEIIEVAGGSGVAVTVARYQTPSGTDINKIGITPDVKLPAGALPTDPAGVCTVLAGEQATKLFG